MSISSYPPPAISTRSSKEDLPQKNHTETTPDHPETLSTLQTIAKISTTIKNFLLIALSREKGESAELTAQEKEFIAKAADTLLSPDGAFELSGTEAGSHLYLERYFQNLTPDKRRLLHIMFHFLECSPIIFGPRHTLFTSLNATERAQAMNFADKSLYIHRVALQSLRFLLTLGYLNNPQVIKKIGCEPNQNPFNLK
ncbi:hypothetical protein IT411_03540 [Candidatus Peregrinibacteria bacterium]|nr:hypothetical protein [Candidatus Peregrinibacteria bacterium]